ncbi:MAG TPA: HNH endonuclease signature motif containing protein [Nocardioides sp.]|uniref:HNH endonuclease signature motif containing protein n=1 Tax=Nocardioides sp. TaxID=35761 RepID=UPI002EDA7F14
MAVRRKYTEEMLSEAVAASHSVADVLRALGLAQAGGTHAHISRTIKKMGIDTSHFQPHRKNGSARRRLTAALILVRTIPGSGRTKPPLLRRAMLEMGVPYRCAECGLADSWQDRPIRLHVDHVDGDYHNNLLENLRFLCPNCHSQTSNFAGLSRGKYTGAYTQIDQFAARPNAVLD